ncbi:Ig-like domain-containing protein [Enterococcus faecalis]
MKKQSLLFPLVASLAFGSVFFRNVNANEVTASTKNLSPFSSNQALTQDYSIEKLEPQIQPTTTSVESTTPNSVNKTGGTTATDTSSTADSSTKELAKKAKTLTATADGFVGASTNAELEAALAAKEPKIRILAALTFDRDYTINHNVVIDFQNLAHNAQTHRIFFSEQPSLIEFQNFKITGADPAGLFGANQDENAIIVGFATDWLNIRYHFTGTLRLTGGFNIYGGSKLSTFYIPQGKVILDGVAGNIDIDPVTEGLYAAPGKCYFARVYRLEIINGTQLTAPYLGKFYGRLDASSEQVTSSVNSGIFVSGGSKIMISYNRADSVSDEGEIIDTLATNVFLQVEGTGTEFNINTQIDITNDNNRGIVQMRGSGSQVNVAAGGKIQIDTKTTSAFRLQGTNSQINVISGGSITVNMEHDKDTPGNNGMRFVGSGLALSVDGPGSSVKIEKNSGKSPAIRFENGNQTIKVTNGGALSVHNVGDGNEYSNHVSQGNQAILFDDTTGWFDSPGPATFSVEGEKSSIDIRADSGATLDTTGELDLSFNATEKTYLVMIGKTGKDNSGIISGNKLQVYLHNPTYFDFQNRRIGSTNSGIGGWVFQGNSNSTLEIINSEIALWHKNEASFNNFDQDPNYFSDVTDLQIVGTDLDTVSSTSSPGLLAELTATGAGMKSYNRISANNQLPVIDDLRVPTNADKKIYGHVSVPEGVDAQLRDAWADEVEVTLEITYADATKAPVQLTTQTVGQTDNDDGLNPWGEGRQGGLFELAVPDGQYLKTGDTIQVISAKKIKGAHSLTELNTSKTTVDIVPPEPAVLNIEQVNTKTTTLSGTGEAGASVMLMKNRTPFCNTTVDANGQFTLTIPENSLAINDKLEVFLNDNAGEAGAKGVINKPITNDGSGNYNPPGEALQFHDATFLPATVKIVEGTLSFEVPTTIDFGTLKVSGLRAEAVGQTIGRLLIFDQRHTKQAWSLKIKESQPLAVRHSDGSVQTIPGTLYFAAEANNYQLLSSEAQTVATGKATGEDPVDLTGLLTGSTGFKVVLSGNQQIPGQYSAEFTWILEDAPQK